MFHFLVLYCVNSFVCVCVAQIFMISVMRWTVQVPDVLSLTVAAHLELSWDRTDKHVLVSWTKREEERGPIWCATDNEANMEDGLAGNGF